MEKRDGGSHAGLERRGRGGSRAAEMDRSGARSVQRLPRGTAAADLAAGIFKSDMGGTTGSGLAGDGDSDGRGSSRRTVDQHAYWLAVQHAAGGGNQRKKRAGDESREDESLSV